MGLASYSRRHIAEVQLETALRLYFEGADDFSVLSLAGAADEILGRALEAGGGVSAFASLTRAGAAMLATDPDPPVPDPKLAQKIIADRANRARNVAKDFHPGIDEDPVSLDVREEATDMLDRAIANYAELYQAQSPAMQRFMDEQRRTP